MKPKIKVIESDQGIAICVAPIKLLSEFTEQSFFSLSVVGHEVGLFCLGNEDEVNFLEINSEVTHDAFKVKFINSVDFDNTTCEGF